LSDTYVSNWPLLSVSPSENSSSFYNESELALSPFIHAETCSGITLGALPPTHESKMNYGMPVDPAIIFRFPPVFGQYQLLQIDHSVNML
jgi:hypothetical protein